MHTDLEPFVITQLAGVLALLTRLGWLDVEEYRNVQKDIHQFLQASVGERERESISGKQHMHVGS